MSNVKEISIVARCSWDWAEHLSDEDAGNLAALLFNPVIGVHLYQEDQGYVANDHGGRTSMYRVVLSGREALPWPRLERIVAAFASVGTVLQAMAKDVEDGDYRWEEIKPEMRV